MVEVLTSLDLNPAEFSRKAIDSARKNISAVIYKFTDPYILEALVRALHRGVRIQLLMNEKGSSSAKNMAGKLASLGTEIRVWKRDGAKLHAKFMVADRTRVYTGSNNWTLSARKSNMELLLKLEDALLAKRFNEQFERLWAEGTTYSR